MDNPKLETSYREKDKKLVNETLSEFITQEVSQICLDYVQNTGKKPPQGLIKNLTFMLYNSYHKKEIMRHERNE